MPQQGAGEPDAARVAIQHQRRFTAHRVNNLPAVKLIGLLSELQRARFSELGILQFETAPDPFESLAEPPPPAPGEAPQAAQVIQFASG